MGSPSLPRRVARTASDGQIRDERLQYFSIRYFARNVDNLLVGWRFGAQAVGVLQGPERQLSLPVKSWIKLSYGL